MSLSLERLLLLAAPFFLAVSASKKKRARKPAKQKSRPKPARTAVKRKRAKKPVRRSSRAASKKQTRVKPKKSAARGRRALPTKLAPKPVTKPAAIPAPVEPPPKPVAPVGRPILLSPEQGKYADSVNPRFRWLSVGGATRYEVNWSQDANLANAYTVISIATEAAVPVEKPLTIGATYYWRARGGNEAGWGPWSNIGSFGVIEETE
jgi:hypothetical protein